MRIRSLNCDEKHSDELLIPNKKNTHYEVITVNTDDLQIGTIDKMLAHQQGVLHRAFSIFIFRKINCKKIRKINFKDNLASILCKL